MAKMFMRTFCFRSLFLVFGLLATGTQGLSWGGARRGERAEASAYSLAAQQSSVSTSGSEPRLSNSYMMALNELQELESEPLCIRIAARLLISNCQVLDGQDDATVLTNAGRVAQDFVDSFAASLAICDLERANFRIPSACSPFQEPTLARLPISSKPHLHVTTAEIRGCLEGLAQSDSAWNTWLTYKHKAMRFCEAARSDNEKDQTIKVHKKITQIFSSLSTQVEEELKSQFQSVNAVAKDANEAVANLNQQVHYIEDSLAEIVNFIVTFLIPNMQQYADSTTHAGEEARKIEALLALLFKTAQAQKIEMIESHQIALRTSTDQVNIELEPIMTMLVAVRALSSSLHEGMEKSLSQASGIVHMHEDVEKDLRSLKVLAVALLRYHEEVLKTMEDNLISNEKLQQGLNDANQAVTELSGTINSTSQAAASLHVLGRWMYWLHVVWSLASIILACDRLLPSTLRNLLLLGLASVVGRTLSTVKNFRTKPSHTTIHLDSSTSSRAIILQNSEVPLEKC